MTGPFGSDLAKLDVEGWRPLLMVLNDDGSGLCDAAEDLPVDDPTVLRIEQWIVAGEQYIYVERESAEDEWSRPELGECEVFAPDELQFVNHEFYDDCESLLSMMCRYVARGARIHPVLREML